MRGCKEFTTDANGVVLGVMRSFLPSGYKSPLISSGDKSNLKPGESSF
jgi:hypothetical protein